MPLECNTVNGNMRRTADPRTGGPRSYTPTSGYVRKVLQHVHGATASTPMDELSASQLSGLQSGQQAAEGWVAGFIKCSLGGN